MMSRYNGIDHTNNGFNVLTVSLQTILSNWLGPVWWSLASLRILLAWFEVTDGQTAQFSKNKTAFAESAFNNVIKKNRNFSSIGNPRSTAITSNTTV